MKRHEMIKDSKYFSHIIKTGNFFKNNYFVIYYVENSDKFSHFGIAIKKNIGKANVRNRLKRQVRMIVTQNKNLFKLSRDYIIMIRDGCLQADYKDMETAIVSLMKGENNEKK